MARGVFITGTDTGVGKTIVTAAVTFGLRAAGIDAVPMKPVQTGCRRRGGRLVAPDLEFSLAAAGLTPAAQERKWMAPYLFQPAMSPHLAARLARTAISLTRIERAYEALRRRHDFIVVEGAGGVLVPVTERLCMVDVMRRLALPVIVVARPGLGTINHTVLAVRELQRAGLRVAGIVFNATWPGRLGRIEKDNQRTVERMTGVPVLAALPYWPELGQTGSVGKKLQSLVHGQLPVGKMFLRLCDRVRTAGLLKACAP